MERALVVYTTCASVVEAETLGKALVEARLAACVNILPGMVSWYRWQGSLERGEEAVLLVKTRDGLGEAVRAEIRRLHSYGTPAIMMFPPAGIDPDYAAWIMAETQTGAAGATG